MKADKKTTKNSEIDKILKKFGIPIAIVVIAGTLLIIAPWQTDLPVGVVEASPEAAFTPDSDSTSTATPDPDDTQTPEPDPILLPEPTIIINPLTGEEVPEDVSANRPFAVSIGNTADALPHLGIGEADIIVEYMVEGTTRIVAIFQDVTDVGIIGSTRSARTSTISIADSFDAMLVSAGGNTYQQQQMHGSPVTRFGTLDSHEIGYRESSKPSPHNLVVTGNLLLSNRIPDSYRREHDEFEQGLRFTEDGRPEHGLPAENVMVDFIRYLKRTRFAYSEDKEAYFVYQYGSEMIDGNDGERVSFTNILILQTDMRTGYNSVGHTHIRTTEEGSGFFVNGGAYTEIMWSRLTEEDPFTFTLTDGTELELGVGKTYICIIDLRLTPDFS